MAQGQSKRRQLGLDQPSNGRQGPVATIVEAVRDGRARPTEIVDRYLSRIAEIDPEIRAFISVAWDSARRQAEHADRLVLTRQPEHLPALCGVPFAVKDTLHTRGLRTTGGSRAYEDFVPTRDSLPVRRLRQAGAIVIGKTATPEFAMGGGLSFNTLTQDDAHNPWDLALSAGGSSGGSAAAVAADLVPFALGSDAAGSIRVPASWCGVVGLKPTNAIIRTGASHEALDTLSVVGPITRSTHDAELILSLMVNRSSDRPRVSSSGRPPSAKTRVAWFSIFTEDSIEAEIAAACRDRLRTLIPTGVELEDRTLDFSGLEEAFGIVSSRDLYQKFGVLLRRPSVLTAMFESILVTGRTVTSRSYAVSLRVINSVRRRARELYREVDLVISPTVGVSPYGIAETLKDYDRPGPKLRRLMTYTLFANATGAPSISVPIGLSSRGLPIGLLITGRPRHDGDVLAAAHLIAERSPHLQPHAVRVSA